MRIYKAGKRKAFSLLEMVIALALGMVLLLALYMTLSISVNHAQTGREVMADGAVARSIMSRINNDLCNQVGTVDPRVLQNYGLGNMTTVGGIPMTSVAGASNALTADGTTAATTTSSSSTPSTSSSSSTPSSSSSTTPSTSSSSSKSTTSSSTNSSSNSSTSSNSSGTGATTNGLPAVLYNVGVRGDATSLILSVYRVQRPPVGQATDVPDPVIISDVTRINYWLISNGGNDAVGLARQEIKQATHTDIDLALTDISNPNQYLISDEVKNVLFEYFDGTTWQPEWDGSVLSGPAGQTPIGPPAAIRITLTLRRNTKMTQTVSDNPDDATNTYVHVVALPTSNNPAPMTPTSP